MGGVVLVGTLTIVATSSPDDPGSLSPRRATPTTPLVVSSPAPVPTGIGGEKRGYALATAELAGLSPDVAPGTPLELWVTWTEPISKEPSVQKLLDGVTLERIVPPVTPDGPEVAVLSVSSKDIPDLIYGDRFGALSVALEL